MRVPKAPVPPSSAAGGVAMLQVSSLELPPEILLCSSRGRCTGAAVLWLYCPSRAWGGHNCSHTCRDAQARGGWVGELPLLCLVLRLLPARMNQPFPRPWVPEESQPSLGREP